MSPFNPPFKRSQLLSVGESGHVTVRLSHFALPQAGGKEIGVFAHAGLIDIAFPTGQADSPAAGAKGLLWALLNTKEFIVNH